MIAQRFIAGKGSSFRNPVREADDCDVFDTKRPGYELNWEDPMLDARIRCLSNFRRAFHGLLVSSYVADPA
jgi:hypothetical protein